MTKIGNLFDELVVDNVQDFFDNCRDELERRRHASEGLTDEEKVWAAESWTQKYGQQYCDAIYAAAKKINDNEDMENSLDVRINDSNWRACYYVRSQMSGGEWSSRTIGWIDETKADLYCRREFGGKWGSEAAELCAMTLTAALAKTFEDYGFYVEVFTEKVYSGEPEKWCFNLSWEYGVAEEEPDEAGEIVEE